MLEKRHANLALEPPFELLEEVPVGWVSREPEQEEMSFPQRHRRVVGVSQSDLVEVRVLRYLEIQKLTYICPPRIQAMLPWVIGV